MNDLRERLDRVRSRLGSAKLVAVTKATDIATARQMLDLGVPDLAENRPQQLWERAAELPHARWHFIGHLQRNKLERTLPLCALVHSVDSLRLLQAISAFGVKMGTKVPVLLEFNCSRETAKGGFAVEELPALADAIPTFHGVDVQGLMTMAAYHDDPQLCRPAFAELRQLRQELRTRTGLPLPELSMGMSHDFAVAVEEGSTMVRLGSVLFAE